MIAIGVQNGVGAGGFCGMGRFADIALYTPTISASTMYTGALNHLQFLATYVKYFNDEACDALILDSRANAGGDYGFLIACMFGGDRKGFRIFDKYQESPNSSLMELSNSSVFVAPNNNRNITSYVNIYNRIVTSEVEACFPSGVFKGSTGASKKIVFLTDTNASSGGDTITRNFYGDNYDGNLGSNTFCKVMGQIDGRLCGANFSVLNGNLPTLSSNRLNSARNINQNVDTSPAITVYGTGPISNSLIYPHRQYPEVGVKAMATGATGTFNSTIPGCTALKMSYEDLIWVDLGLVPNTDPNRWIQPGTPDPANYRTWKDTWLEQAIREACVPGM